MGKLRGSITGGLHAKGGQGAIAGPGPSPTRRHSTALKQILRLPVPLAPSSSPSRTPGSRTVRGISKQAYSTLKLNAVYEISGEKRGQNPRFLLTRRKTQEREEHTRHGHEHEKEPT